MRSDLESSSLVAPLSESREMWGNNSSLKKRRLEEGLGTQLTKENRISTGSAPDQTVHSTRNFIRIPSDQHTFHTEDWKNKQTSVYVPLMDDIMVNLQNIEQLSLLTGTFHIGDELGSYTGSSQGHVLHLWRYDSQTRKLFISRSFLFVDSQGYNFVRRQLEDV